MRPPNKNFTPYKQRYTLEDAYFNGVFNTQQYQHILTALDNPEQFDVEMEQQITPAGLYIEFTTRISNTHKPENTDNT